MVHSCHARNVLNTLDVLNSLPQDDGPTDEQDSAPQDYGDAEDSSPQDDSDGHSEPEDYGDTPGSAQPDSPPQDTPQDPPPPKPHDPTPQEWVDAHNAIRKPEGVVLMHWNESLAAYAQNYIKKIAPNCKMEHSGGPYGECLFQGDGAATAKEIVDYWASEKKYWDPKSKKCAEDQDCGHYLQVVNPNSPSLGCAKAKCANDVWYHIDICSYTW
ncbi:hypothetical protein AgCh_000953 [Apium graveolens]